MRIWYPGPLGDDVVDDLQRLVPEHEVSKECSADVEMLIEGRPSRQHLEACPNLRWVVIPFAGVPKATIDLVAEFAGLSLHNLHHNAAQTAETAVALLMAAAKRIVPMDQALRGNDWSPRYSPEQTQLLDGKTCLILGFGEIGRRIGAILEAMGMEVLGVRRRPEAPNEYSVADLPNLLPRADALVISLPLTSETQGLLGWKELSSLPTGAILVNVARAQIVDEQSLYLALESRKLHSAGLDVWYRYPAEEGSAVPGYFTPPPSAKNTAPSEFPFGKLDNVVMSPHRGGATAGTEERRIKHLAALVEAAARGGPVPNSIGADGY